MNDTSKISSQPSETAAEDIIPGHICDRESVEIGFLPWYPYLTGQEDRATQVVRQFGACNTGRCNSDPDKA